MVSDAFMFADDTKIFRTISDESDIDIIQKDLDELFNWSKLWLLKFHPDKCKVHIERQIYSALKTYKKELL